MRNAIPSVAAGFPALSHNPGMAEKEVPAPTPPAWAQRFRAHMRRHNQSQEGLGAAMDPPVGQAAVGHWLRGLNQITIDRFFQLCTAAGADPREILFGETSAQAALETLRDHVVTRSPDKQFVPPSKPAETMPPKATRSPRGASKPPRQPKTPETASGRPRGR